MTGVGGWVGFVRVGVSPECQSILRYVFPSTSIRDTKASLPPSKTRPTHRQLRGVVRSKHGTAKFIAVPTIGGDTAGLSL